MIMNDSLRVLVVDDDQNMAKTLSDILKVKGYETETACSGTEALEKVTESEFDCVLSDIKMPDINGVELHKSIKSIQPDLPVVLMTAYSSDNLVEQGLAQGAIAVLNKPLDIVLFFTFLSLLRKERSVVIVDDDDQFCKTLGDVLTERGFAVTQIGAPYHVAEMLEEDAGVVLLDMKLNGIDGLGVLREIREKYPDLPVILVTGHRAEMISKIEEALKISAYTCLYKPLELENLFRLLAEIHHNNLSGFLRPKTV